MTEEFPPNSHRAKDKPPDRPKVDKVVTGEVVLRKKPVGRRLLETFFGSDDARGVWQSVVQDVIVPTTKDLVTEVVITGVERAVFGEVRSRGGISRGRPGVGHVPYHRYSQGSSVSAISDGSRELSNRARARHDVGELTFESKAEANEVLDVLDALVEQYEVATLADFYGAAGVTPKYVDENFGWDSMSGVDVARIRGGRYILTLPAPKALR